ncbi:MAG: hypothetical protein V1718_00650 [archaeon]
MRSKRKGSSQIDGIIGFLFFIMIVVISLYYLSYVSKSRQPYEDPLKSQLIDLSRSVEEQLTWTAYTTPLSIKSGYLLENYPLSIYYEISNETKNSTYIYDELGNILTTEVDIDESKVWWTSNLINGKNQYHLFYITDSSLNESSNSTINDFIIDGLKVSNTVISAEFDNFSITSLIFNEKEFVDGGIMLQTSKTPLIINNSVRSIAKYPENISVILFMNSSRLRVHSNTPKDFVLHMSNYLTQFYVDGSSHLFNGTNRYDGITGYADLYNDTGIAVIGKELNMTIDDTVATRDIYLFNETDFELYTHTGNFQNMLNESAIYPGPEIIIGLPEPITGIREDRISELEALYYEELEKRLEIDDLGVLIKVEDPAA